MSKRLGAGRTLGCVIDSRIPRFAQALQALILALGFLLGAELVVPVLAVILVAAAAGGPRWNLFAQIYKALPIPPGELEPAAPPRFAQTLGAVFLVIGSVVLVAAEPRSTLWWFAGWGPAVAVAVLAGLAATTSF